MKKIGTSLARRRRDPIDAITLLMRRDSACQSGRFIARIRRELITILNYVHDQNKGKAYRDDREDDEIIRKDFTTEFADVRRRAHIEGKKGIATTLEVKEKICLAIEFLESKKAPEVLEKILQEGGFSKLFSIANKVEEEYVLSKRREISRRNRIGGLKFKKKTVFAMMSGILGYFDETRPLRAVNFQELLQEREEIEKQIIFLDFAERIGLTSQICLQTFSVRHSPTFRFFSEVPEIGFLDLFIFIRVFCEVFGHQPESSCSLPKSAFQDFQSLFIRLEKEDKNKMTWKFSPQVSRLYQSVERCFPKEAMAEKCLSHLLQCISQKLNVDEDFGGYASLQAYFPGEGEVNFSEEKRKRVVEKDKLSLPTPCFEMSLDEVMEFEKDDFHYLIKEFPSLNYWHTFFLDEKDPGKMASFLNRVASLKSERTTKFARDSMILLFSLEKEGMEDKRSLQDILQHIAQKKGSNFSAQVFLALEEHVRDGIRRDPDNDISLRERIDDTLTENFDTSVSPLIRSSFWHPSFIRQGLWEHLSEEVLFFDIFAQCPQAQYEASISYLLKRRMPENEKDIWADLYQFAVSHNNDALARIFEKVLPKDLVLFMITKYIASDGCPNLMVDQNQVNIDLPYTFFLASDGEIYYPRLWPGAFFLKEVPENVKKDLLKYWTTKKALHFSDDFPGVFDQHFCFLFTKTKNLEEDHIPFLAKVFEHGFDERMCELLKKKAIASPLQVRKKLVKAIPRLRAYLAL